MKLIICNKCGRVIENYKEGHNKATIDYGYYDLCDSCLNDIMKDMKFPYKENEKVFIEKISFIGMYETKKIKEVEDGNK